MRPTKDWTFAPSQAYAVQMLARHQLIEKLLADILFDAQVCAIEGWDAREFPRMIRKAMEGLG